MDYDKWDNEIDMAEIEQGIEEAKEKKPQNYDDDPVPPGKYDVAVVSMTIGETGSLSTNPGSPKVSIAFEILNGEFEGRWIWYNQVILKGNGIHFNNEFLRSMIPEDPAYKTMKESIVWEKSYKKYGELLKELQPFFERNFEYSVKYTKKGSFANFHVAEIYDLNKDE